MLPPGEYEPLLVGRHPVCALRAWLAARLLDAEWRHWQCPADNPLDRP